MKRTTVLLPSKLKAKAERQARSEGVSLGELIRDALERRLTSSRNARASDPLFTNRDTFEDDFPPDVSSNIDKYLYDDIARRKLG